MWWPIKPVLKPAVCAFIGLAVVCRYIALRMGQDLGGDQVFFGRAIIINKIRKQLRSINFMKITHDEPSKGPHVSVHLGTKDIFERIVLASG